MVAMEWTNQHGCGGNSNVNCEIVIQYVGHRRRLPCSRVTPCVACRVRSLRLASHVSHWMLHATRHLTSGTCVRTPTQDSVTARLPM